MAKKLTKLLDTSRLSLYTQNGIIKLTEFFTNIKGRITKLKINSGSLGVWANTSTTTKEPETLTPPYVHCMLSSSVLYYKLETTLENQIRRIEVKDCDLCVVRFKREIRNEEFSDFPILWNGDYCVTACYPWQVKDPKTGTCWQIEPPKLEQSYNLTEELPVNFLFNPNPSSIKARDNFSCGDGIVQRQYGEECEHFGLGQNLACSVTSCTIQQGMICKLDFFGKSECSNCSTKFCTDGMNENPYDFVLKQRCLRQCQYYEENSEFKELSKIMNREVYINEKEYALKQCSAFQFNVEEKLTERPGDYHAFRYCNSCIMNVNGKITRSDDLFVKDPTFKLCFPKEKDVPLSTQSFILTEGFLATMSIYAISTAVILVIITPAILVPTKSSVLFYSFWELLQINYMWSYHLAKDSASRKLFKELKFVNFEFGIDYLISRWILSFMVDPERGIILLSREGRAQYTETSYAIYQIAYQKYFLNDKIGVLLYDAAPLFDIMLFISFFTVFFIVLYHIGMMLRLSSDSRFYKWIAVGRKVFGWKLYLRIFMEIQPVLMFHCLSQGLFFNTDTQNMFSVFTLTNKVVLNFVMFTAVWGLPVYCLLIITNLHKDRSIEMMIYKSGKGDKVITGTLFFLNMIRKMLFSLMFLPALESANSAWFAFFIILIQFVTLSIILNSQPYVNKTVNYNQFGGNLIQMMAALTILMDKVIDNFKNLSLNERNQLVLTYYEIFREHYLILTFLIMITVYMISAIAMISIGRKKLRNYYLSILYGNFNHGGEDDQEEEEEDEVLDPDDEVDFKGVQMVNLLRY